MRTKSLQIVIIMNFKINQHVNEELPDIDLGYPVIVGDELGFDHDPIPVVISSMMPPPPIENDDLNLQEEEKVGSAHVKKGKLSMLLNREPPPVFEEPVPKPQPASNRNKLKDIADFGGDDDLIFDPFAPVVLEGPEYDQVLEAAPLIGSKKSLKSGNTLGSQPQDGSIGASIKEEAKGPASESEKQTGLSTLGLIESEKRIKKKSPSQNTDQQNDESLLKHNSQVIRAHSYRSGSNNEDQGDRPSCKKDITSAKNEELKHRMFSEEACKEMRDRDTFSNPTEAIKKKERLDSNESEVMGSKFENYNSSLNTQNLISKIDDTNSKSKKSGQYSHINPSSSVDQQPAIQITDVQKLLELINQQFTGNRDETIQLQMTSKGQWLNINLNPNQLLSQISEQSNYKLSESLFKFGSQDSGKKVMNASEQKPFEKGNAVVTVQGGTQMINLKSTGSSFLQRFQAKNTVIPAVTSSKPEEVFVEQKIKELYAEIPPPFVDVVELFDEDEVIKPTQPKKQEPPKTGFRLNKPDSSVPVKGSLKALEFHKENDMDVGPIGIQPVPENEENAVIKAPAIRDMITEESSQDPSQEVLSNHTNVKQSRLDQIKPRQNINLLQLQGSLQKSISHYQNTHLSNNLHMVFSNMNKTDPSGSNTGSIVTNLSVNAQQSQQHSMTHPDSSSALQSQKSLKLPSQITQFDRMKSLVPDQHKMFTHDETECTLTTYFQGLQNQPVDKLRQNEMKLLIEYQNQQKEKDARRFDELVLFLKRKYAIDQDEELFSMIKKLDLQVNSKLHLAFLFASPLVCKTRERNGQERLQKINQIDYQTELQNVLEGLKQTGNNIKFRKICATHGNFLSILSEGTFALHFSGHGVKNDEEIFPVQFNPGINRNSGDFLVFENEDGVAFFLPESDLKNLLEKAEVQLELVFVASCHSEKTGRVFHKAGVKHVICIRQDQQISDEAQIYFSQKFYYFLFEKSYSICKAFDMAQISLQTQKNESISKESWKFVIIRDVDNYDEIQQQQFYMNQLSHAVKHTNCLPLGPFGKGQVEDMGQVTRPLFRLEMSKLTGLFERFEDMSIIISLINKHRLVTIYGMPGIGKTTIAKTVGFYLEEREKFSDGIIFVTMNKKFQANMLISALYYFIKKNALKELGEVLRNNKKDKDSSLEGPRRNNGTSQQKEIIVEDIEEENTLNQSDLDNIISILQSKQVLLIIDNIEDPLHNDGDNLKAVMEQILNSCSRVKMLLTTRTFLKQIGNIEEVIHIIEPFEPHQSVRLFLAKARQDISIQEVQQLLMTDHPRQLKLQDFQGKTWNDYYKLLEEHPFFLKFSGHPHAICLIAPMTRTYQLLKLYELVGSRSFLEGSQNESHQLNSLKLSLQASVSYVLEKNPKAVTLFSLIGQMPGGVTIECLVEIWGSDWYNYITDLENAQLVHRKVEDNNQELYKLLPFMHYFSNLVCEQAELQDMHISICKYFVKMMRQIYYKIGVERYRDNFEEYRQMLANNETNIWAALDRIKEYNLKQQAEKVQLQFEQNRNTGEEEEKINSTDQDTGGSKQVHAQAIDSVKRQNSKIDKFDYMLTLQKNVEVKNEKLMETQLPKMQKRRSNSVRHMQSVKNFGKKLIQNAKYDTKSHKSSDREEDDEDNFVQIGTKANLHLPDKQKILKDLNSSDIFQLYDSDTSFAHFGASSRLKKPQSKIMKENNLIVPSSKVADYLSDNDDVSFFMSQPALAFGKAKTMKYQHVSVQSKLDSQSERENNANEQHSFFMDLASHMNFDATNLMPEKIEFKRDSQISRQYLMHSNQIESVQRLRSNSGVHDTEVKLMMDQSKEEQKKEQQKEEQLKEEQLTDELRTEEMSDEQQPEVQKPKELTFRMPKNKKEDFAQLQKVKSENNTASEVAATPKINQGDSKLKQPTKLIPALTSEGIQATENNKNKKSESQRRGYKYRQIRAIEMPVEGRLIIYYASNLILENTLDQAINVLSQYGLKYHFEGERGICNKANVQKLLAISYFMHNRNFHKIEALLNSAKQKFKQLDIFHGLAVISLAKAQFFYQKSYEFVDLSRTEDDIVKAALKEIELSSIYFNVLRNKMGEIYCLQLRSHILQKLGMAESKEVQRKNAQLIKEMKKELKENEDQRQSTYIERNACQWLSLIIEVSFFQFKNYPKHKMQKANTDNLLNAAKLQQQCPKNNKQQQQLAKTQKRKSQGQGQNTNMSKSLKQSMKLRNSLNKSINKFKEDKDSPRLGDTDDKNVSLANQTLQSKLQALKKQIAAGNKEQDTKQKQQVVDAKISRKQSGNDNDLIKTKPPKTQKRFSCSIDSRQAKCKPNVPEPIFKNSDPLMSENSATESNLQKVIENATKPLISNSLMQMAQNIKEQTNRKQVGFGHEIQSDFDFSEISRIDRDEMVRKQQIQLPGDFSDTLSYNSNIMPLMNEFDQMSSNTDLKNSLFNSSMESNQMFLTHKLQKLSPKQTQAIKELAPHAKQMSKESIESGDHTQIESSISGDEALIKKWNEFYPQQTEEEEYNLDLHFIEEAEVIEAKKMSKVTPDYSQKAPRPKSMSSLFNNNMLTPSSNHLVEETLEVDKSKLTPEQLQMITLLYDMFVNTSNEAERQNLRTQINQYLLNENIAHKSQKAEDHESMQVMRKKSQVQLQQSQTRPPTKSNKMNLQIAKTLGRKQAQDRTKFYQPLQPEINELDNESASDLSQDEPQIAQNHDPKELRKSKRAWRDRNNNSRTKRQLIQQQLKKQEKEQLQQTEVFLEGEQLPQNLKVEESRSSMIKKVESKIKDFIYGYAKQAPQEDETKKPKAQPKKTIIAFGTKAEELPSTKNPKYSKK